VKRLEGLERIASSYKGVERVFAIQAGREIRVVVVPDDVDDVRMTTLSEEIARRIEAELQYPGQIKVRAHSRDAGGGLCPIARWRVP
jgi:ribonuclease Y